MCPCPSANTSVDSCSLCGAGHAQPLPLPAQGLLTHWQVCVATGVHPCTVPFSSEQVFFPPTGKSISRNTCVLMLRNAARFAWIKHQMCKAKVRVVQSLRIQHGGQPACCAWIGMPSLVFSFCFSCSRTRGCQYSTCKLPHR